MAILQADPSPITRCGGKVPDLNPHSYPPPEIKGIILTLGFFLTYNAPIPFGP